MADTPEQPAPPASPNVLDADWLRDFYKECGRETTLAYTTLNQMKNWAITVQGVIVAAIASFSKNLMPGGSTADIAVPILIAAVLAYLFTLRFFVRAMLCYINLSRWNTLQASIIDLQLVQKTRTQPLSRGELEARLTANIRNLYHRWLSPLTRTSLIASNLKLGFGILMIIPVLMILWAGSVLVWTDTFVRALVIFAFGATVIETIDFFASPYFDTVEVADRRNTEAHTFPAPQTSLGYISQWVFLLTLATIVALWPWITVFLWGVGPLPNLR